MTTTTALLDRTRRILLNMADQPTDQIEEDNPSPALKGSESEGETNPPKRPKVGWQESLITLIASQQEQLAQLARQSNMATKPTPNMATCVADVPNSQMFKLAEFNPDTSSYAIEEWLDDATKLKNELHVGDILMIVKAGEALKGRAHHYYCNWRPSATIEVLFTVVADDVMPATLDAIIGWDIIGLPHLKLVKTDDGLELHHDLLNPNKVLTIKKDDLDNINVSGLDEQSVARLIQLLRDSSEKTPDHVLTGKLQIRLKDSVPVAYRPRRLAYAERLKVQQIVRELLQAGIVRESHSEYASPIVLVKKKNGESRMCVDYRDINKKAIKERYPLPLIHDQIDQLSEAKYFTTLDMKSGFHQMEIEEESKHITAFITPDGLYEYNRMPFGYVNSPSVYQRAIDKALGELKGKQALVYIDDVIIPSKTIEEGFQNLEKVLTALSSAGFRLNYQKCTFFTTETEYLGVVISAGTVRPSARKVAALTQTAAPTSVKGVHQMLGLASYFRRFIKNFSMLTAPISALLKKNNAFEWSEDCESARQLIIKKLTETPCGTAFSLSKIRKTPAHHCRQSGCIHLDYVSKFYE
jgi:hypothetical protein